MGDVGNAGTVLRFVPPAAVLADADVEFRGDDRAAARPVGPLLAALRELGAVIDDRGRGAVPFTVRGRGGISGGTVTLDASGSSQLVSGLLLSAPRYDKGVEVRHEGRRVPSAPHIAMTVQMLRDAGAEVEVGTRYRGGPGARASVPDLWHVHPGVLRPAVVGVEPDLSNAAPFLAAALVTGGSVTIAGWPERTSQPAGQILDLLTRMGASCSPTAGGMQVTGAGTIHGIAADLGDVPELVPVLTALAALADSPSAFTGIGHMRGHESDRLAALAGEIGALGGDVAEREDGLEIRPRPLRGDGVLFSSHDDHRMVMAAAVLGLALPGGLRFLISPRGGLPCWSAPPEPADRPRRPRRGRCAGTPGPGLAAADPAPARSRGRGRGVRGRRRPRPVHVRGNGPGGCRTGDHGHESA